MVSLPEVNAVWIGNALGPVHAACLRSFLDCGHKVRLHCYEPVVDAPRGVELFDAARLMGKSEIVRHQGTGSLALASDIYRYRILKAEMGIYVDCDVFCLKPFPDLEWLFGWEANDQLGSAVLGMPAASAVVRELVECSSDPNFIPPWLPRRHKRKLRLRALLGAPVTVSRQGWGAIGPHLVTFALARHGLLGEAQRVDVLYPLSYSQADLLNAPDLSLQDLVTPRSIAIHLWNAKSSKDGVIVGSPLWQIMQGVRQAA